MDSAGIHATRVRHTSLIFSHMPDTCAFDLQGFMMDVEASTKDWLPVRRGSMATDNECLAKCGYPTARCCPLPK